MAIHATTAQTREHLIGKLSAMLQKVDKVPITRQQKLPSVLDLHGTLPPQTFPSHSCKTTSSQLPPDFSKDKSGLAKLADPNRLFLPKANGGLELIHLVTVYKNTHTVKAGSHMYSGDSAVRAIATQNTLHESQLHRASF